MELKVCPILLHMISIGHRQATFLILRPATTRSYAFMLVTIIRIALRHVTHMIQAHTNALTI